MSDGPTLRARFTKLGKVRFLSHRDLARVWERALRRAGIRVAYSEGFSPRPRLSFGLALSTGYESLGEYLDIDLADDVDPAQLPGIVSDALPHGMEAQIAITIPPGTDSLQQAVTSCPRGGSTSRRSTPRPWTPPYDACWRSTSSRSRSSARAPRQPSTPDRRSSTSPRTVRCSAPSWPRNPAASARRSCFEPSTRPGSPAEYFELTNGRRSTAPAASRSPSGTSAQAARRRPRMRKRVRHEKGTPR